LSQNFTVIALERRGRGQSGDGPEYSVEQEYRDIATVVDSLGRPANLLGHSFGALCSLEAALLTSNVRKLVLYEPVVDTGVGGAGEEMTGRLEEMLTNGDREGLLSVFYREIVGLSPEQVTQFKEQPDWADRVAAAHTIVRESQVEDAYVFDPARFQALKTPTLLLEGGDSPELFKASTRLLHAALPNSSVRTMPGQQHIAMITAPELFLQEVTSYLES